MRPFALFVLTIVVPGAAAAQQLIPGPLTLSGAVEQALRSHPSIRESQAGATAASDEIAVAQSAYLPRLDLLWQANRATRNNVFGLLLPQLVVPPVSGPVLPSSAGDSVWNSAGGLLASWEVLDFGRRGAGVNLARAQSASADAVRRVTELTVAGAAADAYLTVLAADAALTAARANEQRLSVFEDTVRSLVRNQLRAGAEQSRAEAELAAARTRVAEAERDADLARVALAEATGQPGTRVDVDSRDLSQLPPRPAAAPFDPATHPRSAAAQAEVDAVRAQDRVLQTAYTPQVHVQGAFSGRGVSREVDGTSAGNALGLQTTNWAVGLTVTFPLLEGPRTGARRRVEADRLQQASAQYDRTLQALQSQAARARVITTAALRIAENAPQQLQAARDTDLQVRARYDAGLTTVVDVAEAQRLLAEAEANSAVAILAVWRAWLAEAILQDDVQVFLTRLPGRR
jgi:outer membrane protein TolC